MAKIITILTFFLLITTQSLSFSPENPKNPRILILLDDFALKSSHSIFFNSLQSRGYRLDFKLADDPSIALQRYGQFLYDGLIIFAPTIDRFGGSINQAAVLEFVDSGRDLIVALDVNASDLIREIATESGVDFDDDPGAMVIDHTSYALSDTEGDHTLLASDELIQSDVILGKEKIEAPILFLGIGHSVNPANNLVLKVLSASPSAYSAVPTSKLSNAPMLAGSSVSLVSIVQARNNARILISGSLRMFSDKFFRSGVRKAGSSTRFELIRHDVVEPPLLEVDQIYHLACPDSPVQYKHNPVKTIKTNVVGTLNMLGLAKRVGATGSTAGMNPAGAPASTPTGSSALNRVAIAGSAVVVVMAYALMM